MATSKTLNAANLEALGAARLAALLLEVTADDAPARRRLRLALTGGGEATAHAVAKRLASIARSTSWLDWHKIKPLLADLDVQQRAILDVIAPADPRQAFDLLWRLVDCAENLFERCEETTRLSDIFDDAIENLGPLAQQAGLPPEDLADRVVRALAINSYGAWDELIPALAPPLGTAGLAAVRRALEAWRDEKVVLTPDASRHFIAWAGSGPLKADELEAANRRHAAGRALRQVADALGDVDGFVAQHDKRARAMPAIAAEIAQRLLAAGRAQEALAALDAAEMPSHQGREAAWERVRLDTLESLGRADDAQAFRWTLFMATLNAAHLRVYLGKLADFDDVEAEQRALAHALAYPAIHSALGFLVAWPDLQRASELVLGRTPELNGDFYEVMAPAAEALDARYPLAATLLRRAMIDFTLRVARATRYKHGARHLHDCRQAAARVEDFGSIPDHPAYERALQAAHGRKAAFWQEVVKLG